MYHYQWQSERDKEHHIHGDQLYNLESLEIFAPYKARGRIASIK